MGAWPARGCLGWSAWTGCRQTAWQGRGEQFSAARGQTAPLDATGDLDRVRWLQDRPAGWIAAVPDGTPDVPRRFGASGETGRTSRVGDGRAASPTPVGMAKSTPRPATIQADQGYERSGGGGRRAFSDGQRGGFLNGVRQCYND